MVKSRFAPVFALAVALFVALGVAFAQAPANAEELVVQSETALRDLPRLTEISRSTSTRTVPAETNFSTAFGVTNGYPVYNENFDNRLRNAGLSDADVKAQKAAVVEENGALLDYDAVDAAGNLYKGGVQKTVTADGKTVTKLVRHTA